ncbi:RING-H2 finger protein ATL72 [Triticum urartu]|uniref:RING-H2 finger protein ATL72 n=1 Tax=Triticum urartu TaxID=4572 RepID=M7ZF88_TRIUA|nr:RING-H2 finger protein ATL72 [Triticum urartu]
MDPELKAYLDRMNAQAAVRSDSILKAMAAGLKRKALRKIPVEVYGGAKSSGGALPVTATECAICLGEFADGEKVRVLPRCHHGFHVRCIDMWLATHTSCPNCRASLAEDGAAAANGGGR